jgi:hypothetical protein
VGAAGVSRLWIMIAGPYRAGAEGAAARAANLRALNEVARFRSRGQPVYRAVEEIPEAG